MDSDQKLPDDEVSNDWLRLIVARHPYAFARHCYLKNLALMAALNVWPGYITFVFLEDCVAIFRSPDGWLHGCRVEAGTTMLQPPDGHALVRCDPWDFTDTEDASGN